MYTNDLIEQSGKEACLLVPKDRSRLKPDQADDRSVSPRALWSLTGYVARETLRKLAIIKGLTAAAIVFVIISGTSAGEEKADQEPRPAEGPTEIQASEPVDATVKPERLAREGIGFGKVNVTKLGAKGDGKTDDTEAIQRAIDLVCERGGGTVYFPYTPKGYLVGKPGVEKVDGKPCRSQLHIRPGNNDYRGTNIQLEGEHPCSMLYDYAVRPWTTFESMAKSNTFLFSTWESPEETNPEARPWSILATVEGDKFAGKFSVVQVSIKNLEFRAFMNTDKMFPTGSAVNLQNAQNVNIQDSQFTIDKGVGDNNSGKMLQTNPCHTVGLFASGNQNDNQILRNVAVQGFRYGFVLGEHVVAESLYVHNCEEGIVFHDSTHLSHIQHVVAQHNQKILTTTRNNLFGTKPGTVYLTVEGIDLERGSPKHPVNHTTHGVYDPGNRFVGYLKWHSGHPPGKGDFPVEGAKRMKITKFGE
ncbi:glycosyl hydrolase family 28-related protein [Haloferula sp.]|uniref:glycosyl hydrolase family 28-related protein n=1 Tax=Haloferula sp. TaxID=2497595 RepID=UPI003C723955